MEDELSIIKENVLASISEQENINKVEQEKKKNRPFFSCFVSESAPSEKLSKSTDLDYVNTASYNPSNPSPVIPTNPDISILANIVDERCFFNFLVFYIYYLNFLV
jgi:hypothetical protein